MKAIQIQALDPDRVQAQVSLSLAHECDVYIDALKNLWVTHETFDGMRVRREGIIDIVCIPPSWTPYPPPPPVSRGRPSFGLTATLQVRITPQARAMVPAGQGAGRWVDAAIRAYAALGGAK